MSSSINSSNSIVSFATTGTNATYIAAPIDMQGVGGPLQSPWLLDTSWMENEPDRQAPNLFALLPKEVLATCAELSSPNLIVTCSHLSQAVSHIAYKRIVKRWMLDLRLAPI